MTGPAASGVLSAASFAFCRTLPLRSRATSGSCRKDSDLEDRALTASRALLKVLSLNQSQEQRSMVSWLILRFLQAPERLPTYFSGMAFRLFFFVLHSSDPQ